jgi:inosine-uridine nucleoside N-ribohydrolase
MIKLIIDCDPGVDDILALLLALNDPEVELKLISLTFGNVPLKGVQKNLFSMFEVLNRELSHASDQGIRNKHHSKQLPLVALGSDVPVGGEVVTAAHLFASDGLGDIHTTHPQYTANENEYNSLFSSAREDRIPRIGKGYRASGFSAHEEILNILKSEKENEVVIAAIGPLSNIIRAAETDPVVFSRVRHVVSMGGALQVHGNITPVAEFNVYSDAVAAARVYSLTARDPAYTLPPDVPLVRLPRPLNLSIVPLDTTTVHVLSKEKYNDSMKLALSTGSPLAIWIHASLQTTFANMSKIYPSGDGHLHLHDPLAVWYAITNEQDTSHWVTEENSDIRIETSGYWSRGFTIQDVRGRQHYSDEDLRGQARDYGHWLQKKIGNRIRVVRDSKDREHIVNAILNAILY